MKNKFTITILIITASLVLVTVGNNTIDKKATDTIAEFVAVGNKKATLDFIRNDLYNLYTKECTKANIEIKEDTINNTLIESGMLKGFGVLGEYEGDLVVNRYNLAYAMNTITKAVNKYVPRLVLTYQDTDPFYADEIMLATYAKAYETNADRRFEGSAVLTEAEAKDSMKKYIDCIDKLKYTEKDTNIEMGADTEHYKLEIDKSEEEAFEAGKNKRVIKDTLNGMSSAIRVKPESIEDMESNIEALNIIDPYRSVDCIVNLINIDEGLYDYSKIHIGTDFGEEFGYTEIEDKDKKQNAEEIVINKEIGKPSLIARCGELRGMSISYGKTTMIKLGHPMLGNAGLNTDYGTNNFRMDCYLIRNGAVIGKGYMTSEVLEAQSNNTSTNTSDGENLNTITYYLNFKTEELYKAEYIGLITEKGKIDTSESHESTLMLMDIPTNVRISLENNRGDNK